jgi:hypothetical protein
LGLRAFFLCAPVRASIFGVRFCPFVNGYESSLDVGHLEMCVGIVHDNEIGAKGY